MPPDTVKVDRTTSWGNPFVVSRYGTAEQCVDAFKRLTCGLVELGRGVDLARAQNDFLRHFDGGRALCQLRGKNLACWCRADKPCHADVLLQLAEFKRAWS